MINRLTNKKTLKEILAAYDRQIRKDMGFWIKYRPSCWGDLLPEKFIRPLLTFIKTKGGKKFVLILAFLLSLVFVGVIPTLNFIWSNIFRFSLILLVIPRLFWSFAINSIYVKGIFQAFCKFIIVIFNELIGR